ncbi:MAG: pyruvate, phosphate dikinase [Planctomycetes bacterium]|nr:pyruvate, phosphate dikinase [Planctomycetota bacterium]
MKYVYMFEEADGKNKMLLGGKGAGLAEMTRLGLPVPPGFTVTTQGCTAYYSNGRKLPDAIWEEIRTAMAALEKKTGKAFGRGRNPLLVSVRSGSALSMPGMMDTILNLGLSDESAKTLARETGDERFALDAYRRFIQIFCKVALGVDGDLFEKALATAKAESGAKLDSDLTASALTGVVARFKEIARKATGRDLPVDPWEQLRVATTAVFDSWEGKRARDYRAHFKIGPDQANGTAVNVVAMVFGNLGERSATGVAFTRDPGSGENTFYGEYLNNAQGEDVVAGIRTPLPIAELAREMSSVHAELLDVKKKLESHYREVQDIEFTVERGKLYMLQTRNAKMNAHAALVTSVDLVEEGLISKERALLRIGPSDLEQLMYPGIDPKAKIQPFAKGMPASPGAACGRAVFDADEAVRRAKLGEKLVLVREETKPEDIHGFFASVGILTSRGGKTSHAAVVARGMGKSCVCGAESIRIDAKERRAVAGETVFREGDRITIDGSTGNVYLGEVPLVASEVVQALQGDRTQETKVSRAFARLMQWADEARTLGVYANADTPEDAARARRFGAGGIGLCRTERMFNAVDRLPIVRAMILASDPKERAARIAELLPLQKADFKGILKAMNGLPVTVRLLDPPLHEFLPSVEELLHEMSTLQDFSEIVRHLDELPEMVRLVDPKLGEQMTAIDSMRRLLAEVKNRHQDEKLLQRKESELARVRQLHEVNPMLGHRGVRLGITYPEIYEMQIRALYQAVVELIQEGHSPRPEIMVPQVCTAKELEWVHRLEREVKAEVEATSGVKIECPFGTMIEVVRACMRAGKLAEIAEFFSFGTNDLSQATFSFSREDAEAKFLPLYTERKILQDNPFEILDVKGVGRLMEIAIEWGRKTRPDLKIGICGEHGGQPQAVEFCHEIGLTYVSCSPFRVPIARLAAAQAAVRTKSKQPVPSSI